MSNATESAVKENVDPALLKTPDRSWSPEDEFFTPAARSNSATSLPRESETPKRRTFHGMTSNEKVMRDIEGIDMAVGQLKENLDSDMQHMMQTEWKSPLKKASALQDLPQFSDERQSAPSVKERVTFIETSLTVRRSMPSPVPPSTNAVPASTSDASSILTPPLPKLLGQQLAAEIKHNEVTEKLNESLGRAEFHNTFASLDASLDEIQLGDYSLPDFELVPQMRRAVESTSGARSSKSAESPKPKPRPSLPTKLSDAHARKRAHDRYQMTIDQWLQIELKHHAFVIQSSEKLPREKRPRGYDMIVKESAARKKAKAGKLLASSMITNELIETIKAKETKLQERMKFVAAQIFVAANLMKEASKSRKSEDRTLHTIDESQEHGHRTSTSPVQKDATTSPSHSNQIPPEEMMSPRVESSFVLEDKCRFSSEGNVTSENVSVVTAVEASFSTETLAQQETQEKEEQRELTPEFKESTEYESRPSLDYTKISTVSVGRAQLEGSIMNQTKEEISEANLSLPVDSAELFGEVPKFNANDISMDPFDRPLPESEPNDSLMSEEVEEIKEDEVVQTQKEAVAVEAEKEVPEVLSSALVEDVLPIVDEESSSSPVEEARESFTEAPAALSPVEESWVPSPTISVVENDAEDLEPSPEPVVVSPVPASKYSLDLSAVDFNLTADESTLSDYSFSKIRLAAGGIRELEKGPIEVPSKRDSIGSLDRSMEKTPLDLSVETSSPRRNSLDRFNTTFPSPRRADSPVSPAATTATTSTVVPDQLSVIVDEPVKEIVEPTLLNNSMNMSLNMTEDGNWLDMSIGTIAPELKKAKDKEEKVAIWRRLQESDDFLRLVVKECCAFVWQQKERNGGVALDDDYSKTIPDEYHCGELSDEFLEVVEKRQPVEEERKASLRDVLKIAEDMWPIGGEDVLKRDPLLPRRSKYSKKYPPTLTQAEFEEICLRNLIEDNGPSMVETTSRWFSWENDRTRLLAHEMVCEEHPTYLRKEIEECQRRMEKELADGAASFFSDALLDMKINSARESLASVRGSLEGRRSSIAPE